MMTYIRDDQTVISRRSAFSLVELLVVTIIISVLAASVAVSVRGAQDGHALRMGAHDLATVIRLGFEQSILRLNPHRVAFLDDGGSFRLEAATGDITEPFCPVPGMAGLCKRLPVGVQVVSFEPMNAQPTDDMSTKILCISQGGFGGAIRLKNRRGATIAIDIVAGMGQVHVVEE